jgi:hypothetical protein
VRVLLAQTGRWLWDLGRLDGGLSTRDLTGEAVHAGFIESMPSGFGMLKAVRHSALLLTTPAQWRRPAMPLGGHPARWPVRS